MSPHFSEDQFIGWMAGDRAPAEERHLAECPVCRSELAGMEAVMAGFRSSAGAWSDQFEGSKGPVAAPARAAHPYRWAMAAVAVAALAAIPIFKTEQDRRREADAATAEALLRDVDASLSRRVPSSLEPVLDLIDWQMEDVEGGDDQ